LFQIQKMCFHFSIITRKRQRFKNSDVSELVQNEGKTVRAYNYISGLYAL
jgi:hypothetical protein